MDISIIFIFGTLVLLLFLFGVWLSVREFRKMDEDPQQYRQPEQNERL
ncbi:MAG: hypothetical protein ACNA8K_05020 [Cyclonatronaceae bacterium]